MQQNYRPDLQGLRAIAILLVVLTHAGWASLPGGFIGVDVFFVLSGYLITGILLRDLAIDGRIRFLRFYARRLKRLLPALLLVLVVTLFAAGALLSGIEAEKQLAALPFAASWTSNLFFTFQTINYFDELAARDLFLHTWSLGVEEQFYLLWPILLLVFFRVQNQVAAGAQMSVLSFQGRGIAVALIFSLMLSLYWTADWPEAAFYMMPARIWQFSTGALILILTQSAFTDRLKLQGNSCIRLSRTLLFSGLLLIIPGALFIRPESAYPGFLAFIPTMGAAFVIFSGSLLPAGSSSPLAHPLLVWVGDRSYSWYLWHWPIFILGFSLGSQGRLLPTIGLITLSLIAAHLSYWLIELPFWKGRWSQAKPARIFIISLGVLVLVLSLGHVAVRQLPTIDPTTRLSNEWRRDFHEIYNQPCGYGDLNSQVNPCRMGAEDAGKTVVLLGDSIGAQWVGMLPQIFAGPAWRVMVYTKAACAMIDIEYYYARVRGPYDVCTDWRNAVLDDLDALRPDVIIVGSAATYQFTAEEWVEGSARVFNRLSAAAHEVILIPGTPSLGFDGPGCVARSMSAEGAIPRNACVARDRVPRIMPVTQHLAESAGRFQNVKVLDLTDLVCPGDVCRAVSDRGIVFRDSQHLTNSYVLSLVPELRQRLLQLRNATDDSQEGPF